MKQKNNKLIALIAFVLIFLSTVCSVYAFSFRNMTLDLIQISDTHITDRDDTSYKALGSSKALLADAVDQINNIKGLDFILFTGDLVDKGSYDNYLEFFNIMKKSKYPYLNAFGNHDFYGEMSKDEVLNYIRENNPNYVFPDSYYAISPKTDYRIIVLDSTIKDDTSQGYLSQEQLAFLDNELAENQDKVVVIAMHHPAIEPFSSSEHALSNADEFNEILLKYKNPIIVLSGHYHAAKIRHYGNLVYVSTPAMVTYPMAFRHIKIVNYKDRVQFSFELIPTRLDDIKEANRQSVISYSTLYGMPKDRDTEFTFKKSHPKSANYKRNKIKNALKEGKASKKEEKELSKVKRSKAERLQAKEEAKLKREEARRAKEELKRQEKMAKPKREFNLFKKKSKPVQEQQQEADEVEELLEI